MKGKGKKVVADISADYIGTASADQFIYHFDGSDKTVSGFDYWGGDKLFLDSGAGVYSGIMSFGRMYDGQVLSNHIDTAAFTIHSGDYNADGLTDTKITCDIADGSITLLGIDPGSIAASCIVGG
jgi:hypothetical protein